MISTALSRIARTLTMLTIAKKYMYYRVKVIFLYRRFISNKTSKAPGYADLLILRVSYKGPDPAHTFFH